MTKQLKSGLLALAFGLLGPLAASAQDTDSAQAPGCPGGCPGAQGAGDQAGCPGGGANCPGMQGGGGCNCSGPGMMRGHGMMRGNGMMMRGNGMGSGGRHGMAGHRGQRMYDPATVKTVEGEVLDVQRVQGRRAEGVRLQLQAGEEKLWVHLGPGSYVDQQGVTFQKGDKVTVTGSRVTFGGKPAVIAQEVKKGDEVLTLRDAQGTPRWRGMGRAQAQTPAAAPAPAPAPDETPAPAQAPEETPAPSPAE